MFPADTQVERIGRIHKEGLGCFYNERGGYVSSSQQKKHGFSGMIRIGQDKTVLCPKAAAYLRFKILKKAGESWVMHWKIAGIVINDFTCVNR